MESLYVCLFSNGHIKVGRSIDPISRIAQHADRVSCFGVTLADHFIVECPTVLFGEARLIDRCVEACETRHNNEWFAGLDFGEVCEWAAEAAHAVAAQAITEDLPTGGWALLIAEIKTSGITKLQIAKDCGTSPASISRLALGQQAEPFYSLGERLLEMHATATNRKG